MTDNTADVTLHIDENTTHNDRDEFIESLYTINGVSTATYTDGKPHLVVIKYNSNIIQPDEFLKEAQSRGLHAELIGL
jgi:hypothetical protein